MTAREKLKTNPFKPTAGAEPPVLVGRDHVIDDFLDGLAEGVGAPGRLMRITGPRGSGKTVLLTELGDIARKQGWFVVDVTARTGMTSEIIAAVSPDESVELSADIDLGVVKARAAKGQKQSKSSIREALTKAFATIGKKGILITVDEVQDASKTEMVEIATAVQHLIRESQDIAFIFAGITTGVLDFLNDASLTFLRRAKAEELAAIPICDVCEAYKKSFSETGMSISGETLEHAAQATSGYAFLVQLVGYHVWRKCRKHADESVAVSVEDVKNGVEEANREFNEMVILPALSGISKRGFEYLIEMSKMNGAVATADIAQSLGVKPSALTSTRRTLISKQIIEPSARGYVVFSIPCMQEYLQKNSEELMSRFGA
jgi:molybdopterin-guanine dinucleotide biosynthesis protein